MARGYEFNDGEDQVIGSLAVAMIVVGFVSILLAFVAGAAAFFAKPDQYFVKAGTLDATTLSAVRACIAILPGLIFFLTGAWLIAAAASFRRVVTTRGDDIFHLMAALKGLRRIFFLQCALIVLAFVGVGLVFGFTDMKLPF